MGRLEGRTALIVGGTGGIGLATARRFRQEGARLILSGRPGHSEELQLAQAAFADTSKSDVLIVEADLGDSNTANFLVELAIQHFERLDILFHAAGISGRSLGDGPLTDCTFEGWDAVMRINASAVFQTNQASLRQMLKQPLDDQGIRGTILNLGSVLAQSPSPQHFSTIAYVAAKGAVESMTRAAAAQYAANRIRFNVLAPGLIDTPMARRAVQNPRIQTYLQFKQPLANGPGSSLDVAEAALFLCEPASRFITGVVLSVDGGWRISEPAEAVSD